MTSNPVSAMLREGLRVKSIGQRVLYYRIVESTMVEAMRMAQEGAQEGTVVVAEEQTTGRGRYGRGWLSPPGNLYLSILLYPSLYALRYLSVMTGVASAHAIREVTSLKVAIKWPNDILVRGKKVGGILVESSLEGTKVNYAVVGIGINVSFDPSTEESLREQATGLERELGRAVPRHTLLARLLEETDTLYTALQEGSSPLPQWRTLLDTLGKEVKVQVWRQAAGGEVREVMGVAEDVDMAGNLLLRLKNGRRLALPAGEVSLQERQAEGEGPNC